MEIYQFLSVLKLLILFVIIPSPKLFGQVAMKKPRAPKPLDRLLDENPDFFGIAHDRKIGPTDTAGRYLHWDLLRHRQPPDGLTLDQWWLGIKIARTHRFQEIPLADIHGRPFVYMLPDSVQESLHHIDSKARGSIGVSDQVQKIVSSKEHRERFVINSLLEEAIASSQYEGASTTREVAARMIRSRRKPKDHDEQMILNNFTTMREILQIQEKPLTYDILMQLHAGLTSNTLRNPNDAGRIQTAQDERVAVYHGLHSAIPLHRPPPAEHLPELLAEMLRFANKDDNQRPFLHPVIRAIIVHFWLAYAHPFADGNGRTARALFYWVMLHEHYWMFEFLSISRLIKQQPAAYPRAFLYTETDGNDLTYFITHQIQIILKALENLEQYLQTKARQLDEVSKMLRHVPGLNHRQFALIGHALRHPNEAYTVRSHQTSHGIAYATARADLLALATLQLVDCLRHGQKAYTFYPSPKLIDRIKQLDAS